LVTGANQAWLPDEMQLLLNPNDRGEQLSGAISATSNGLVIQMAKRQL
jgi:hypothetical protein